MTITFEALTDISVTSLQALARVPCEAVRAGEAVTLQNLTDDEAIEVLLMSIQGELRIVESKEG